MLTLEHPTKQPLNINRYPRRQLITAEDITSLPNDLRLQIIMNFRLNDILQETSVVKNILNKAVKSSRNITQEHVNKFKQILTFFASKNTLEIISIISATNLAGSGLEIADIINKLENSDLCHEIFKKENNWGEASANRMAKVPAAESGLTLGPRITNKTDRNLKEGKVVEIFKPSMNRVIPSFFQKISQFKIILSMIQYNKARLY